MRYRMPPPPQAPNYFNLRDINMGTYSKEYVKECKMCWIWGSHSGHYQEYNHLGVMYFGDNLKFGRNKSPPSSASQNKSSKIILPPASAGFLLGLFFDPEDWDGMFLRNVGQFLCWDIRIVARIKNNGMWQEYLWLNINRNGRGW
jgi:hypothetical protein